MQPQGPDTDARIAPPGASGTRRGLAAGSNLTRLEKAVAKAKVNKNKPKAGPAPHMSPKSAHGGHHPATAKAKTPKGC